MGGEVTMGLVSGGFGFSNGVFRASRRILFILVISQICPNLYLTICVEVGDWAESATL